MRRVGSTIGIIVTIIVCASVVRGQGEVFPGAHLPLILSHDPIPTATPIPPTATPIPSGVIPNGDFEAGEVSWTQYSEFPYELIRTEFHGWVRPQGGAWAVWLGGVYAEEKDETTSTSIYQPIVISSAKPYLSYWHWIASADACGYDVGGVLIDNGGTEAIVLDAFNLCSRNNTGGWKRRILDLRPYAGQTVMLYFLVGTDDLLNSNWFVDDVSVQAKATVSGDASPQVSENASVGHMPGAAQIARLPILSDPWARAQGLARKLLR